MAQEVTEMIVIVFIFIGILMSLLSSLGFLRLPDVYTRIHAGAKSITLGTLLILCGAFIYFWLTHGTISIRLLLGIVFVFLTSPVSGQLIIRSAFRSNVPLASISVKDDLTHDLAALQSERAEVDDLDGFEGCDGRAKSDKGDEGEGGEEYSGRDKDGEHAGHNENDKRDSASTKASSRVDEEGNE